MTASISHIVLKLLAGILFLSGGSAYAQCRPSATFASQVSRLLPSESIADWENLKRDWKHCGIARDSSYGRLLNTLGNLYWLAGNKKKALEQLQEAVRLPALPPDLSTQSMYRYGAYLIGNNRWEEAESTLLQVITHSERYQFHERVAAACAQYAYLANAKGDFHQAVEYADKGIDYARLAHSSSRELYNLNQKVEGLIGLNQLPEAAKLMESVIDPKHGPLNPDHSLLAIDIYLQLHQLPRAQELLKQALRTFTDSVSQGKLYNEQGILFKHLGQPVQAQKAYLRALTYFQEPDVRAIVYSNLGEITSARPTVALAYFQRGIHQLVRSCTPHRLSANPHTSQLQSVSRKEYLLLLLKQKVQALRMRYQQTHDPQYLTLAQQTITATDQMIDRMRWSHQGMKSKLYWRNTTRSFYEDAIQVCYWQKNSSRAFYFFEKSRAVLLADRLNEWNASRQLPAHLAEQERTYRQTIEQLQELSPLGSLAEQRATRTRLDSVTQAQQAFIRSLEKTHPTYYQYKYENQVPSLQTVQKSLLAKDQALVSYFIGERALYALGVTPTKTVCKRLPLTGLQGIAQQFLKYCSTAQLTVKEVQQFNRLGYELYQRLLAPLGLTSARFIISSDGVVLPFDAFRFSPDRPSDYLIHTHAFSYTYSAGFLLRKRPPMGWSKNFLGLAPEAFAPALHQQPLPGSVQTLTRIEKQVFFPKTLVHQAATKRAFLEQAADYRILHLFTHADADSTATHEPVLYFADSALKLSELENAPPFRTRLLVLSACKTGVGVDQKGEGVFSLSRGFAALGIPSTITTLWSVENKATYTLIEDFYHFLSQGLPQDLALQKAQLQWLQTQDQQLPYYWSGLIQMGETTPLYDDAALPTTAGIVGGLVLISLGLWWQRRKRHL